MLKYIVAGILLVMSPMLSGKEINDKLIASFERKPNELVYDKAKLFSNEENTSLETEVKNLYEQTKVTVAVATIESLNGHDISELANGIYNYLSIGDKSTNKGILLLISKADKEVRIEVGYGCEGEITDAYSKHIIETNIIPQFKEGKFFGGVTYAIGSIGNKYDYTSSNEQFVVKESFWTLEKIICVIFGFIILNIIGFCTIGIEATLDLDWLLIRILLSSIGSGSSSSGGSGGSSGGGGSRGKW